MTDLAHPAQAPIGNTIQVGIVTNDLYRGIDQLVALGIGPFSIFEVTPENCPVQRYNGGPGEFAISVAFATAYNMMWEVIQPRSGQTIQQQFLDEGRIGFHHVAVDMGGLPFDQRADRLRELGYSELQGGVAFNGSAQFGYFHNGVADAPIVEIYDMPEDSDLEPDEIYPA
jgi:hypothetical protein